VGTVTLCVCVCACAWVCLFYLSMFSIAQHCTMPKNTRNNYMHRKIFRNQTWCSQLLCMLRFSTGRIMRVFNYRRQIHKKLKSSRVHLFHISGPNAKFHLKYVQQLPPRNKLNDRQWHYLIIMPSLYTCSSYLLAFSFFGHLSFKNRQKNTHLQF
jgi:hypothetical protein